MAEKYRIGTYAQVDKLVSLSEKMKTRLAQTQEPPDYCATAVCEKIYETDIEDKALQLG